jgi:ADP-ribose pyrophosphatase YjhB (NUDIX family)
VHHIQRKILGALLYAETLGYAKMRPPGIESNQFAYHLNQLIRDGLVEKAGKSYRLAPKGLSQVDRLSQTKMVDRLQPQIVTAIDLTNEHGETLLFKRLFQPYIFKLGFPLGKTHFEETVLQAAERELEEKTGLTDIPLTQRGIVYIESTMQGTTISKVLYHVFQGTVSGRPTTTSSHRGSCIWTDTGTLQPSELMPAFLDIKALLHQSSNFFFDEFVREVD